MPLPVLNPGTSSVDFQNTSFSIDAVGRFICSTWEEATQNGGPPFTAVIIGAGMYGSYLASRLFRHKPSARVLIWMLVAFWSLNTYRTFLISD